MNFVVCNYLWKKFRTVYTVTRTNSEKKWYVQMKKKDDWVEIKK